MRISVGGETDRESFKENVVDRFFDMVEDEEGDEIGFMLAIKSKGHGKSNFRLSNAIDALETLVEEETQVIKGRDHEIYSALEHLESIQHEIEEEARNRDEH